MTKLFDIDVGKTFKIGYLEFIHLELFDNGTSAVFLKKAWKISDFDSQTNNYANSYIRKELNNKFYKILTKYLKEKDIISHIVDLTALDGRTDYGSCTDQISLLTYDLKRRYCEVLHQSEMDIGECIWLATPYSTAFIGYDYDVCCMNGDGTLTHMDCSETALYVHPFCILNSSIFVSKN